jgi:hypothetical protein
MGREDAYAKYKGANGEPQFADSCVLFFDLLGISAMAQDSNALEHLVRLRPALEAASERAGTEDPTQTHVSTWFTDNLVIGTPVFRFPQDQEGALLFTLVNVSYLFLILLNAGFLGRGGIAFGQHYMDDRFVFGPALIEAAVLEKATKQPRVALTQEAAALAAEIAKTSGYHEAAAVPHLRSLVIDEGDGTVFVDPVGVWLSEEDDFALAERLLETYRQQITAGIEASGADRSVQEKWLWLADYFNWSIRGYADGHPAALVGSAPGRHRFVPFHKMVRPIR